MRILIVDDEPLARARLRAQLGDLRIGTVAGEAGNGVDLRKPAALMKFSARNVGTDDFTERLRTGLTISAIEALGPA